MMSKRAPYIAIVGATGAVGQEAIKILEERDHPSTHLGLFGSRRSAGTRQRYGNASICIEHVDELSDHHLDYALLCADADTAWLVRRMLASSSTVIIDNSSAFRMDLDVPLVIPEVNGELLTRQTQIVANPNCSTIMMLRALDPIRRAFGVKRVIATTYQAVSGAGAAGINELRAQTIATLNGQQLEPSVFPCSCAFNVFEHESEIDPQTGYNGEETKMIQETRRIWEEPSLPVLPTCVRVPVERAHGQSLIADLEEPCSIEQVRSVLAQAGIGGGHPGKGLTPLDAVGTDDVMVGRVRFDHHAEGCRLLLWVCCDQIRKGAALNAVQIMDRIHK